MGEADGKVSRAHVARDAGGEGDHDAHGDNDDAQWTDDEWIPATRPIGETSAEIGRHGTEKVWRNGEELRFGRTVAHTAGDGG